MLYNFFYEAFGNFIAIPLLFYRVVLKEIQLGELTIQQGQSMEINMMISHFNPSIFENLLKFDIDRGNSPIIDPSLFTPFQLVLEIVLDNTQQLQR
ncbi:unnamed protein product [Paramecium sonneborni]|uniref:Uncharacterized protein n=1 Tax=Paramecium sonneborni TaxID=65129 RepID=A0A8S1LB44_9CILI|nr:unnamed protein product [Paramecium sonneborni]